jgi:hypothetical protein
MLFLRKPKDRLREVGYHQVAFRTLCKSDCGEFEIRNVSSQYLTWNLELIEDTRVTAYIQFDQELNTYTFFSSTLFGLPAMMAELKLLAELERIWPPGEKFELVRRL